MMIIIIIKWFLFCLDFSDNYLRLAWRGRPADLWKIAKCIATTWNHLSKTWLSHSVYFLKLRLIKHWWCRFDKAFVNPIIHTWNMTANVAKNDVGFRAHIEQAQSHIVW